MHRYALDNCPVCDLVFTEDDDIVVCPICGTPHHRECYMSLGSCANEVLHEEGFSFTSSSDSEGTTEEYSSSSELPFESSSAGNYTQDNSDSESTYASPLGLTINDSELIDGVPIGDLKKFIGASWVYYIPLAYAKLKGFRIFRMNFSAFLGSYVWLFARKFYLLGTLSALLNLASYLYLYFYTNVLKNIGIDITTSATDIISVSDPKVLFGYYLYIFAANLPFILSLLTALFSNRMYMSKAVKKVKQINQKAKSADEFNLNLEKKGGINMPMLFISLALTVCYFILEKRGIINSLMAQLVNFIM